MSPFDSDNPTFSILTAAYQASETIARTVASVIGQSRDDWELIIVDDGSTDGTAEIALEAAGGDPRIRVFSQHNSGVGSARNTAATHALGEYICLLDGDDELQNDYLECMGTLARRHPDCDLFSCNARIINEAGVETFWRSGGRFDREHSFTLEDLLRNNDVFIMAMIRSAAFRELGGFSEDVRQSEDYELWVRMLLDRRRHVYTPEVLGRYNRRSSSVSGDTAREYRAVALLMEKVLADPRASDAVKEAARRRRRSVRAREVLETARLKGGADLSRGEALATAYAYDSPWRRLLARGMALLSPRWYVSVVARRRDSALAALYGKDPGNVQSPGSTR